MKTPQCCPDVTGDHRCSWQGTTDVPDSVVEHFSVLHFDDGPCWTPEVLIFTRFTVWSEVTILLLLPACFNFYFTTRDPECRLHSVLLIQTFSDWTNWSRGRHLRAWTRVRAGDEGGGALPSDRRWAEQRREQTCGRSSTSRRDSAGTRSGLRLDQFLWRSAHTLQTQRYLNSV